jgi:hypothetical protein
MLYHRAGTNLFLWGARSQDHPVTPLLEYEPVTADVDIGVIDITVFWIFSFFVNPEVRTLQLFNTR